MQVNSYGKNEDIKFGCGKADGAGYLGKGHGGGCGSGAGNGLKILYPSGKGDANGRGFGNGCGLGEGLGIK